MNTWLVNYMKEHEHYKHEHKVVLGKITSIKGSHKAE